MKRFALAAALIGCSSGYLAGQTLIQTLVPDIDVEALCIEQARAVNGGNSQRLYCLQSEQEGYNELKTKWPSASEAVRQVCIAKWSNYSMLSHCVDEETRATADVAKFKFKK